MPRCRVLSGELTTGQMIGPYRLLFRLGKGGMGEVWAAQRSGGLGTERFVALKLLRGVSRDSNAAIMFFDEGRAASQLQHSAIVPTLDLGQYGNTFYIAMGLVRGPSLTALLQKLATHEAKPRVPPSVVAFIGERLASGLDYAYNRASVQGKLLRLVHRDISPHNVLVDEAQGQVLLTDFGVARTTVQDHESRVGTVRGKPSYMAPEQVQGLAIDGRTDIFALGIVLYEAACVKRLFGRSNPIKSMEAVVNYEPKPLPTLVPDFPEPLWRVIARCLEKDPARRYASAGELSRALAEVRARLPIDAVPEPPPTAERPTTAEESLRWLVGNFFTKTPDPAQSATHADGPAEDRTRFEARRASAVGSRSGVAVLASAGAEPLGLRSGGAVTPSRELEASAPRVVPVAPSGPSDEADIHALEAEQTRFRAPGDYAADPLAPEVLREVVGPVAEAALAHASFGSSSSGSLPGFTPQHTYPQITGTQASTGRPRNIVSAAAAGLAAVALGVAFAFAFGGRSEVPAESPREAPRPPVEATPAPEIGAMPGATAPAATPWGSPATAASTSAQNTNAQSPRPSATTPRPTARPEARPSGEEVKPVVVETAQAPNTVDKRTVIKLINRVEDQKRRSELLTELVEAADDPGALSALWSKVAREVGP